MYSRSALAVFSFAVAVPAQAVPKVAALEPAHEAMEVDATKTRRLTVTFAGPMTRDSHSICGGGPKYPKIKGVRWKGKLTVVLDVELEPGRDYVMSLNCKSAKNFRSARGVALEPTPWRFSTLPAKLPPKGKQRALNRKSFAKLQDVLQTRYSYFDHHGLDWPAIFREHRRAILSCRTNKGWTQAVGNMLRPTNDLHLYLRLGDYTVGAGRRRVDPLFRRDLIKRYVGTLDQPMDGVLAGVTDDGFGYLMIGSWTKKIDFDKVEAVLAKAIVAKGIILDVRPNSGGDEMLARRVAEWFVEGTKTYAKSTCRVRKGKSGFGPVLERKITGEKEITRLPIPVVVLMSRYCMSSCEAFLLMMKQAEDCTLIGQQSYGSSGNPRPHELPNGVTVFVPSWKALLPDGTCFEGKGIAPDIAVDVDIGTLDTRDPILEKALEHLRRK